MDVADERDIWRRGYLVESVKWERERRAPVARADRAQEELAIEEANRREAVDWAIRERQLRVEAVARAEAAEYSLDLMTKHRDGLIREVERQMLRDTAQGTAQVAVEEQERMAETIRELDAENATLRADVDRLRKRTHELAADCDKRLAPLQSRLDYTQNVFAELRALMAKHGEADFYRYTSVYGSHTLALLLQERNAATARAGRLAGLLRRMIDALVVDVGNGWLECDGCAETWRKGTDGEHHEKGCPVPDAEAALADAGDGGGADSP